jgi:multimeric flavodoxin WrbA
MADDDHDFCALAEKVLAADIRVLGTPIWRCEKSSVCTRVIERLYALSGRPTTPVSTSTTAASAGSWSPAMRTASSTWR